MAHIGRGVADDAGAPMTAAYGADGHSHQRASSAEGSESQGGRSSAIVRERLFQGITVGEGVKVVGASLVGAMAALAPSQRSGRERPLPSTPPSPHTSDH